MPGVSEPIDPFRWLHLGKYGETSLGQGFTLPSGGSHDGRDVQTPRHTPLTSLVSGVVTPHTGFYAWGGEVDVQMANGITQTFAHLDSIAVKPGQRVNVGQFLGLSGGENLPHQYSTGPHTHVSFFGGAPWDNSKAIDPTALLTAFEGSGPSGPAGMQLPPWAGGSSSGPVASGVQGVTVNIQSSLGTLAQALNTSVQDTLMRGVIIAVGVALLLIGFIVLIWPGAKAGVRNATGGDIGADPKMVANAATKATLAGA